LVPDANVLDSAYSVFVCGLVDRH